MDIRNAILEIRDIQKEKLEYAKKTLHLLESKVINPERSTQKKKKTNTSALEERIRTKIKEMDQIKLDLTQFMKRSRSTQKKHQKSQSIKILR